MVSPNTAREFGGSPATFLVAANSKLCSSLGRNFCRSKFLRSTVYDDASSRVHQKNKLANNFCGTQNLSHLCLITKVNLRRASAPPLLATLLKETMHSIPRCLSCLRAVAAIIALGLLPLCWLPNAQAVQEQAAISVGQIKKTIRNLRPLHEKLGKPEPGQWLDSHKEPGQTFAQYASKRPNVLRPQRNKLYIQPIGDFNEKQNEIIEASREYMSLYFQCEAIVLDPIDESVIPESAKRIHPEWKVKQWLTSTILEDILTPRLPDDAFASIAMTNTDLWPGDGWNFVFGYASYHDRVGVWSLNRLGDPAESAEAYQTCLQRTLKLATHETGHMFSIKHCTKYHCNMQGSNHQEEADSQPMALCPECHAKILFATGCNPETRYSQLAEFCDEHKMTDEATYFRKAIEAIVKKKRKKN